MIDQSIPQLQDEKLHELRRSWGTFFSTLNQLDDMADAIGHRAKDKNAFIDEELRRRRAIIEQTQESITMWEGRRSQ